MRKLVIAILLSALPVYAQNVIPAEKSHHHKLKKILIITAAAAGTAAVAYAASRGGHTAVTDAVIHQPQVLAPR